VGWHPECVTIYRIANFQGDAISHLRRRDHGVCANCGSTPADRIQNRNGRYDTGWCADHVVPLWSVDRNAENAFRYWTLENLQTLCESCHKAKTAREAAERAAIRRAAKVSLSPDPAQASDLFGWGEAGA